MSSPHHNLQVLLGGYVLGGLDTSDRHWLEEHLPTCAECTAELSRFAVVPGLLQLAAVSGIARDLPAPPADSLPKLLTVARLRRRERRKRILLAAAAALLLIAGVAGGGWLATRAEAPTATPLVAVQNNPGWQPPSGQVVLEPQPWGTEIQLQVFWPGAVARRDSVWAIARNCQEEQAGNWVVPADGRCTLTGSTSIGRDQLDHIEVRASTGVTMLRADK